MNTNPTKTLLEEFRQLETFVQKLIFWNANFPINYISCQESGFDKEDLYSDLKSFEFNVKQEERTSFANWLIKNYHHLSNNAEKYKKLLVFELLTSSFEKQLIDEVDKLSFIQKELWKIKTSFCKLPCFSLHLKV